MNGLTYVWKVKMNQFGYGDFATWYNPRVGIIKNNDATLESYKYSVSWADKGNGYALIGGSKYLRSKSDRGYGSSVKYTGSGRFNKDGDVIFVHLDLEKYTLEYTMNGKSCGIAFNNIEPANYRFL